ncbi:universal stress protein [Autumnicola psychrophila]|uniref:Universal stress protein n=1 Tax=Autumnicola psychrophila TaxID=3075592 RepID=A0ABU3DMX9_9FLAO|nr:universal stress protein [Zunongwangia sp. F225]MDT0685074.1 universal stress protein [Zunongwangia sp. F225]
MVGINNILVAVDFDESVGNLLNYTESLAEKYDAKIWLLHVADPEPDFIGYEPGPQYIRDLKAEEYRDEHRKLQALCDRFLSKNLHAEALLIQGSTVEMILKEAEELQADLMIVNTHKHGFFFNLFSESVSLELFKKSNIPLLTIPVDGVE